MNESFFDRLRHGPVWPIGLAIIALVLLFETLVIVPETKQGVILRLNQPVSIINAYTPGERPGATGAGLIATDYFKR
jgi:modulator of FtsH protease HflC